MAKWVYNRPLDCCDETELRVAKLLARLPDEWIVRWGYYYERDREGDFLILGPHGGLLVIEVKGGQIRRLGSTGCWEGEARDHPVAQLCAEWRAVIDQLNAVARGRNYPFVAKALGLPDVLLPAGATAYKTIDLQLILDGNDLADLPKSWLRLFHGHNQKVGAPSREVFLEAYGQDVTPRSIQHFISETDRICSGMPARSSSFWRCSATTAKSWCKEGRARARPGWPSSRLTGSPKQAKGARCCCSAITSRWHAP